MKLVVEITASTLRIRSGPSTSFDTVGFLHQGDHVIVDDLSDDGAFYHMFYGQGWIGKLYTDIIEDMEDNPPPEQVDEDTSADASNPDPDPVTSADPPVTQDSYTQQSYDVSTLVQRDQGKVLNDPSNSGSTASQDDLLTGLPGVAAFSQYPDGVNLFNYAIDYTFIRDNLETLRRNLNIIGDKNFSNIKDNLFAKFNRFKTEFPDIELSRTFSQVFFTRPDLNIVTNMGRGHFELHDQVTDDPVFYYLYKNNPNLLLSLTSDMSTEHDFNTYLSNKAESFDVPDEYVRTVEHGETFTGFKVQYAKNNIESNTAGTISISYTDDKDLSIYKMHKGWLDYCSKVYRGILRPKDEYIYRKVLDYACSVYYFLLGPDGETILFWSKYLGVFPTNTPASSLSWTKGNNVALPNFSINYAFSIKEDFNPLALAEFNANSSSDLTYRRTYEPALYTTGRTLSGAPFIETVLDASGQYVYKLRFRPS